MIIFLNVLRSPTNKKLLQADFYKLSYENVDLKKPFKEITAKPIELVPKVIEELQSNKIPIRVHYCNPDVNRDVRELLLKSLMSYYRATLPEHCSMVKISKDENKGGSISALLYESLEEEKVMRDFPPDVCELKGAPTKVAIKVLDSLNNGYWYPAKVTFEDGVLQEVKDLFITVIDLYNQSIKTKLLK